jgi:hypothetical protein
MRVPSGLIGKRVENGEGGWAKTDAEPSGCRWLLLNQALSVAQEFGDFVFFAWFCLEFNK